MNDAIEIAAILDAHAFSADLPCRESEGPGYHIDMDGRIYADDCYGNAGYTCVQRIELESVAAAKLWLGY